RDGGLRDQFVRAKTAAALSKMDRTAAAPGLRRLWIASENRSVPWSSGSRGVDRLGFGPGQADLLLRVGGDPLDRPRGHGTFQRNRPKIFSHVGLSLRAALDPGANREHLLGALLALRARRLSVWRQNLVERDWRRLDERRAAGRASGGAAASRVRT